jgi:hypothetical protein
MPVVLSPEKLKIMEKLGEDNVPGSWIAETVGCAKNTVYSHVTYTEETVKELRRVWTMIRRNPDLLKLHREFAPHNSGRRA